MWSRAVSKHQSRAFITAPARGTPPPTANQHPAGQSRRHHTLMSQPSTSTPPIGLGAGPSALSPMAVSITNTTTGTTNTITGAQLVNQVTGQVAIPPTLNATEPYGNNQVGSKSVPHEQCSTSTRNRRRCTRPRIRRRCRRRPVCATRRTRRPPAAACR